MFCQEIFTECIFQDSTREAEPEVHIFIMRDWIVQLWKLAKQAQSPLERQSGREDDNQAGIHRHKQKLSVHRSGRKIQKERRAITVRNCMKS